ncbi:hypothetical protein SADUNF_Sadunf02G0029500 [Salix dunnii]|uniref:Uncharacterized protein n=1 Tax=Salix dunnii TaxID=1413687 RepID=A0A835TF55_9ROSI|nr:hypothetical protein SADUNF_Sadunf02G0029500 [Salix dunnii]
MAKSSTFTVLSLLFFATLPSSLVIPHHNSFEQDSLFQVLYSINSAIPWRSAPHGIVCEYFAEDQPPPALNSSV